MRNATPFTAENVKARLATQPRYETNGCRLWGDGEARAGYGMTNFEGKDYYVHRLAWEIANGPVPDGLCVLRKCHVPNCFALGHLYLGTHKDDFADSAAKGRVKFTGRKHSGESHPNARVTEDIVRYIRKTMDGAPRGTQRKLAEELGITEANVSLIVKRKAWGHVV